ncbi:MAG: hypothetical protein COC05_01075 [Gammaproteobacteria bacterium]|nr:MAG: hypothetical protein COC05_01075 [Gammaproteobacteria bacterium]
MLEADDYRSHVHTKGKRNQPLTDRNKKANSKRLQTCARVEHVFGLMENEQNGMFIRAIGMAGAKAKIGSMNLVYNIRRRVSLSRIALSSA